MTYYISKQYPGKAEENHKLHLPDMNQVPECECKSRYIITVITCLGYQITRRQKVSVEKIMNDYCCTNIHFWIYANAFYNDLPFHIYGELNLTVQA